MATVLAAGSAGAATPRPDVAPTTPAQAQPPEQSRTQDQQQTLVVGWDRSRTATGGTRLSETVSVTPAYGRDVEIQQQVDGTWLTRRTVALADAASVFTEIRLPRQWAHAPETVWRLRLPGTDDAAPATSEVQRVAVSWVASEHPDDATVLVNKDSPIEPERWRPEQLATPDMATLGARTQLVPVAADALTALANAAQEATGKRLVLVSGFRPAAYQERLFARYAAQHGTAAADRFSARTGHSEHQTGWAADVTQAGVAFTRFGGTPTSDWVAKHAWRHGFVVRYPEGGEKITGYRSEPWHLRYVGADLAAFVHHTGLTLEEVFDAVD